MSKNSIKKLEEILTYSKGIELMRSKNYTGAIEQFMLAEKVIKTKITPHDYNYININQALCYKF